MKIKLHTPLLFLLSALIILLSGCGGEAAPSAPETPGSAAAASPQTHYEPEYHDAAFHADIAQELPGGQIDLSCVSEGYLAVSVQDTQRLKFQIIKDDNTYTYDLPGDGTPTIYPFNMGEGSYTLRLMRNVDADRYTEQWSDTVDVTLTDEFQPFLRPNQMVNYTADSACVTTAKDLTADCADDLEAAGVIYDYVVAQISYDYDKAKTVEKGYLPNPDETLSSRKGICYDYAALTAAMLRSLGIPCQLITGYVGEQSLYHAWNRIYIQDQGWLTVEIKVTGTLWKRVDTTFASTGTAADQLEDDSLYTTRYTY